MLGISKTDPTSGGCTAQMAVKNRQLNISWKDVVRNESIREQTSQEAWAVSRLRWLGHVQRMSGDKIAKQVLHCVYQKKEDEVSRTSSGNIWSTETLRKKDCPGRKQRSNVSRLKRVEELDRPMRSSRRALRSPISIVCQFCCMVLKHVQRTQLICSHYSLRFNNILFKIFGAMTREMFREISKYFGINPLEEVVSAHRDKFLKRYCTLDNLCQLIHDKH